MLVISRIFLCAFCISLSGAAANFDLIISHARVADGTGAPAFHADVGLREGKIAFIGKGETNTAARVIDGTGLILAPGFIDVHTHAEDIAELPGGQNFIQMGVTTLMLGNCGGSAAGIGTFLKKLETNGISPNVATLVGHNTVRRKAMGGSFDRPPTAEELEAMRQAVRTAMREGAFGLSTGLIYLPGTFSKTEEIVELARVAAEFGGIYASHMRDEALRIDDAIDELLRISREAQIRAHISHIKLSGRSAWGRAAQILQKIDHARETGLDITQDQYSYTASSTGIAQLVPEWAREGGKFQERVKDPALHARMKEEMRSNLHRRGFEDYSYTVIAHDADFTGTKSLDGLNIVEAARKRRGNPSLDDQIELILEVQDHASGVFHGIGEEDLQVFMRHPNTMIASDSGVRRFGEGVPHPRGYGNNARILGRYVRELQVLRLEEAIRRMTSLPASAFRIAGRGQIQEGFWADLVLFDPAQVKDRATFTAPHQFPSGIEYVLVNGEPVLEKGTFKDTRPGRPLRLN